MADEEDKPRNVEMRPLSYCEEHKAGVAVVRDEAGEERLQRFRRIDPDFPYEGPVLNLTGAADGEGWQRGQITNRRSRPKVNQAAYERGWERIFGNKTTEGEA